MQNSNQGQEPLDEKPAGESTPEIMPGKKGVENAAEVLLSPEKNEVGGSKDDQVQKDLRQKIENIDLDDSLRQQVSAQANSAVSLSEEEKMKVLLEVAKKKGVVYAVNMAKKMNDPYILDALHDILAKEGHYKDFLK